MARFKDPSLQRCYEAARKAGADLASEFYTSPLGAEGPRCPRVGAAHREAYWKGRAGVLRVTVPGSQARAFWTAGQDDAKALGAVHPRWVSFGIMGGGLATVSQLRAFLATPEGQLPW
jgi:hypothetical protein